MVECRHCRRNFREEPENLGARCPSCRQPLFERAEPAKPPLGPGMQACAVHPSRPAVATCKICRSSLCHVCRTRWRDQPACPACVERLLASPATISPDSRSHARQALWSLVLGLGGWLLFLLGVSPLIFLSNVRKDVAALAGLALLASLVPALFAVGQGAAAVRQRGNRLRFALAGLVLSSSQLGLLLGLLLLGVWAN